MPPEDFRQNLGTSPGLVSHLTGFADAATARRSCEPIPANDRLTTSCVPVFPALSGPEACPQWRDLTTRHQECYSREKTPAWKLIQHHRGGTQYWEQYQSGHARPGREKKDSSANVRGPSECQTRNPRQTDLYDRRIIILPSPRLSRTVDRRAGPELKESSWHSQIPLTKPSDDRQISDLDSASRLDHSSRRAQRP